MKANALMASLVLIKCQISLSLGYAQGFFNNLNFELANVPNGTQTGILPVNNALPFWDVYYGTSQQSQIQYNDISLGSTAVTLVGNNDPFGPNSIEGNFSVFLQGGVTATDASIRQTGLIPLSTESILFKAQSFGPALLTLDGQLIPYVALGAGPNYTLFGADISSFAGQTEELGFSVPEGLGGNNALNLDSIVFSPDPVPEPATWTLLLCGAVLLDVRPWRQKQCA